MQNNTRLTNSKNNNKRVYSGFISGSDPCAVGMTHGYYKVQYTRPKSTDVAVGLGHYTKKHGWQVWSRSGPFNSTKQPEVLGFQKINL